MATRVPMEAAPIVRSALGRLEIRGEVEVLDVVLLTQVSDSDLVRPEVAHSLNLALGWNEDDKQLRAPPLYLRFQFFENSRRQRDISLHTTLLCLVALVGRFKQAETKVHVMEKMRTEGNCLKLRSP